MEPQLKTPILLLTFNRLENTRKVFKEIRKIRQKKLFITQEESREIIF